MPPRVAPAAPSVSVVWGRAMALERTEKVCALIVMSWNGGVGRVWVPAIRALGAREVGGSEVVIGAPCESDIGLPLMVLEVSELGRLMD